MLAQLPSEILAEIINSAIEAPSTRPTILLTTLTTYHIGLPIIYQTLAFYSKKQLQRFISYYEDNKIPYPPRSVVIKLGNDAVVAFSDLHAKLFNILKRDPRMEVEADGRVVLDLLRLRMNSFTKIESSVYQTLSMINPRAFIWTGPDPQHHFSLAIVPSALESLLRAAETYTNLTYLKLGNFAAMTAIPHIPSLRRLYLGRAVFLDPSVIARFVLSPEANNLESLRLVDTYQESIWGPRVRRSDVETAAIQHILGDISMQQPRTIEQEQLISAATDKIRRIVRCEGVTERIIGGDRVSDVLI
ncbi:hypothetical protein BDN72DRAFT_447269 [Pluteus cervinus]|uniref:Uncharacterized protein n=1 Tax=Pluteus cervinus TaxID=181527 RepID=A0ACD3BC60_9AGAR|nr:hypothetical protein BDN72DRAFT_447269 [Pluteus cervinus]